MSNYEVVIIGAGISGINAAYRLQKQCPDCLYIILDRRGDLGGTWDLFKYPGVRSDTDLYTLGFSWRPWTRRDAIADAGKIKTYMRDCAAEEGIDRHIRYSRTVVAAEWSSPNKCWRLQVAGSNDQSVREEITGNLVFWTTGYYSPDQPLSSPTPGLSNFQGRVVHPQFWPEDLDFAGKEVVVVGSGATAVTVVPNMAEKAARVTMLQRSPGYIISLPVYDVFDEICRWILPQSTALLITRVKFLLFGYLVWYMAKWAPGITRKGIQGQMALQLPESLPANPHFTPRYRPWEQRLCLCPGGDFFTALRSGKATVVTDEIDQIAENGIKLRGSGQTLPADIIVTATGLQIAFSGGIRVSVNSKPFDFSTKHLWKTAMVQDLPNSGFFFGNTNTAWTLGVDCAAVTLVRVVQRMRNTGSTSVYPAVGTAGVGYSIPFLTMSSTYVRKASDCLPKVGTRGPWRGRGTYFTDWLQARYGSLDDGSVWQNE